MKKTIVSAVAAAGFVMAFGAHAQNVGVHEVGLIGQSFEFDNTEGADVTEFGAFYNLHNFNTVEEGYIYRANVDWTIGDEDGLDSTTYDVGFTSGYRTQISSNTSLDLLAGIGHKNWNVEGQGLELTTQSTYFRYGAALQTDANSENTLRLEIGSRLNVNGDLEAEINQLGSRTLSIQNDNNLYAEASLMTESTGIPLRFSAFYENREYETDVEGANIDGYTTGLKVSALF